jgi:DNA-directed RNA polymerase specialized sigma24 family protein
MTRALSAASLGQAAEAAVVALAMSGDAAAFCELVRRRQSGLRNLLRRLCRDPALADDLAQQVFLQAWRSLPGLRSVAAFGAWLRRLALNAWLAHLRAAPPTLTMDAEDLASAAGPGAGRAAPARPAARLSTCRGPRPCRMSSIRSCYDGSGTAVSRWSMRSLWSG